MESKEGTLGRERDVFEALGLGCVGGGGPLEVGLERS